MAKPPDLDLNSVYAKLAWAKTHFDAVDAEISIWRKDDAHRIIYERNEDFTQHYLRAEFASKPRLERWALMIGDCVTNLRDTLDHAIYAIAHIPGNPMPAHADKAAFLIRECPTDFIKDAKRRLCSVPDDVRKAVLDMQPFNRHDSVTRPPLSLLAELANGTKHKLLAVVFTVPKDLNAQFINRGKEYSKPATVAISMEGIVEGHPFLIFETPIPDPDCNLQNAFITVDIAVAHAALPANTRYDSGYTGYGVLLKLLFEEVEYVIQALEESL